MTAATLLPIGIQSFRERRLRSACPEVNLLTNSSQLFPAGVMILCVSAPHLRRESAPVSLGFGENKTFGLKIGG